VVTVGGSDSVPSLSVEASTSITFIEEGSMKNINTFIPRCHVMGSSQLCFPQNVFNALITSWFCGNESMKTVPFKLLTAMEIKNTKERYKLSLMKKLM
jgi:hypothetical protein